MVNPPTDPTVALPADDAHLISGRDMETLRQAHHAILRAERLEREKAKLETELRWLADIHHRTVKGAKNHDPENLDWTECPCGTCARVAYLLRQSTDA